MNEWREEMSKEYVDEKAVRKNYRALKVHLENKKSVHLPILTFSLPSEIRLPLMN